MKDSFEREINYMRVSITDRCNLRCRYCMPEGIRQVPMGEILTFEEIEFICRAAAELGIKRLKITGGEPLVRLGCPKLVGKLKKIPGIEQVTLTTNGVLLGKYLDELMENGLDAVNVSLDTLNQEVYRKITGFSELGRVRENLTAALEKGLRVKVNCVLQKGVNEKEWEALAGLAKEETLDVRFIEMMPIGYGRIQEGIAGDEILQRLQERYPGMKEDDAVHGNGPAVYYRIPGFAGSIGFISAVHQRFCSSCNRIRLTAKGELKSCLCYEDSADVKRIIRDGLRQEMIRTMNRRKQETVLADVKKAIREAVSRKPQMHCFEEESRMTEARQMVQIGG